MEFRGSDDLARAPSIEDEAQAPSNEDEAQAPSCDDEAWLDVCDTSVAVKTDPYSGHMAQVSCV